MIRSATAVAGAFVSPESGADGGRLADTGDLPSSRDQRPSTSAAHDGSREEKPAPRISIVVPCVNEEATIGEVVGEAISEMRRLGYDGEVVVIDHASDDRSRDVARRAGARVAVQPIPGYGAACIRGIEVATGEIVVFADGDGTYDFSALSRFVEPLRVGYDLVLGTRRNGRIADGAMGALHRHVLEPLQNWLFRRWSGVYVSDVRCGMRSVRREALESLRLGATGMEFASELVVLAARSGLRTVEVPVRFRPRTSGPQRRSAGDGWRVVRQIVMLSPAKLYLLPGALLLAAGLILELLLLGGPLSVGALRLDYHFMFVGSALAIFGLQLLLLGIYAKTYGLLTDPGSAADWLLRFHAGYTLERGLFAGAAPFLAGFALNFWILVGWIAQGKGDLFAVRPAILALTLMVLGAEVMFAAVFLSMLRAGRYGRA